MVADAFRNFLSKQYLISLSFLNPADYCQEVNKMRLKLQ